MKNGILVMLCIMLCGLLLPAVRADMVMDVTADEPFSISFTSTNGNTGEPFVGYTGVLVKYDGSSWDTSPVIATDITDPDGIAHFTVTEEFMGTFYYKFHLPAVENSWSGLITINVRLPPATPEIDRCSRIVSPGAYSLNNDIETVGDRNCIEIRSSNVVFDGMGHTIRGAAPDDLATVNGIFVEPNPDEGLSILEDVLIKNVTVSDWNHGMLFSRSAGTIAHAKASGNYDDGIRVDQCTTMTIRNVTAEDGVYRGFGIAGSEKILIVNSSATGNTGKDGKGGLGIRITNSTHITVKDSNLHDNYGSGAVLINTTYSTLAGNNLNRNGASGMAFTTSMSVNATRNRIAGNGNSGISLTSSTQNSFSDNYLDNTNNVVSDSTNRWNLTKHTGPNMFGGLNAGGNYWAAPDGTGFSQTCADTTRDGICDAAYVAGTGTTDYLPLSSFAMLPLPGITKLPTDPDHDGIFEDLNANGRMDFADVVLYFNQMTWIAENEPIAAFDLNGNGRIDFADIVALFNEV